MSKIVVFLTNKFIVMEYGYPNTKTLKALN